MKMYRIKEEPMAQAVGMETLAEIAHDLRSPMCCVAGAAQMALLASRQGKDVGEQLGQILAAVETMDRMLLGLCEAGQSRARSMRQLREAVLAVMAPRARAKGQTLSFCVEAAEGTWLPDGAALERVLMNLIGNAIKYTQQGGEIRVTAQAREGMLVLRVADNGMGMKREFLQKMYVPFERAQESAHLPGKGLGLSIVRKLVQHMGGSISVSSAWGKGTVFTVRVPCGDGHMQ